MAGWRPDDNAGANSAGPSFSIQSSGDRIVPAAAAPRLRQCHELALGHVGMIVSRKAPEQIWSLVSEWLSNNGG